MNSHRNPDAEPKSDEIRLAELVDDFEAKRALDDTINVGSMRGEAGDLFPELQELTECLGLLQKGFDEDSTQIPQRFGPYLIESELGAGVSGRVFRAHLEGSADPVALKVMHDSLALSEEKLGRFRREISIADKLGHPNIVRVVDHGDHDGRLYLAMDLVGDGVTLGDVLDEIQDQCGVLPGEDWLAVLDKYGVPKGPKGPPADVYARRMAKLFAPAARALASTGRSGLVHRDLKPNNMLLDSRGSLMLVDFGLARVADETMTATGAVLGTPAFMSPEQATGQSKRVDVRSDIYGLGASLYDALTLAFPVHGDSVPEILLAIALQKPDAITAFCPEYPVGLAQVVARCLEKEPQDRYQDPDVLARDLERVAAGKPPRMSRVPLTRRVRRFAMRRRRALMISAAAMLLLAVGALLWFTRSAQLVIDAFPAGAVALNDEDKGQTRFEADVERGEHRVRVSRERFVTEEHVFSLGAGEKETWTIHLRPSDPFDSQALRIVATALNVSAPLPTGEPSRSRAVAVGPNAAWHDSLFVPTRVVRVRRSAPYLVLYGANPVQGLRLSVGETGEKTDLAGVDGALVLTLSVDGLADGETHMARLTRAGDERVLKRTFEIVDADALELPEKVRGRPDGTVLEVSALLEAGFHAEAFAKVWPLVEKFGDRKLPLRLALDALAGLGLKECPLYPELLERHNQAKEAKR